MDSRSDSSNKISGFIVSVRGQVGCRATFSCAGGPGDDLGMAENVAGCCLGNPSAMAYTPKPKGSENCFACIGVW